MGESVDLSVVVLAWEQLERTRLCIESVRANTDVSYELIIVDNGSADEAAEFAQASADVAVLNESNVGFAAGMNGGLAEANGRLVAFVNNDTVLPPRWASKLLGTFSEYTNAGIVLPAVTAAGNPISVRASSGSERVVLPPFRHLPSGVVYLMETSTMRSLGGWDERYGLASREDLDLLFTVWVNALDVVLDERVLVAHESNVTAREQLTDRDELWRANGRVFVDRWMTATDDDVCLLAGADHARTRDLLEQAHTAAYWLSRVFDMSDQGTEWKTELRTLKREQSELRRSLERAQRPQPPLHTRLLRRMRRISGRP